MEYDIKSIARKHGFDEKATEKACRVADILEELCRDPFLRARLRLIGGTALNFIYCDIARLSVDLDFNYRHIDVKDWGDVRKDVDKKIKSYLGSMGYEKLKINPTYPLGRIVIFYRNIFGLPDEIKIEIGYINRISILKKDVEKGLVHLGKERKIRVPVPQKEELFAGKLIASLHRCLPRDVFDVASISKLKFDEEVMRKCAVLQSLSHEGMRLGEMVSTECFERVHLNTSLAGLLKVDAARSLNFDSVKTRATELIIKIMDGLTDEEMALIDNFYELGQFEPSTIDKKGIFNEEIKEHPAINWALRKIKAKSTHDRVGRFESD